MAYIWRLYAAYGRFHKYHHQEPLPPLSRKPWLGNMMQYVSRGSALEHHKNNGRFSEALIITNLVKFDRQLDLEAKCKTMPDLDAKFGSQSLSRTT